MEIHTKENPWDLLVVISLTLILIPIIVFMPDSILRPILGLPFLLFFPGYALISTLFPEEQGLDRIERLALSFSLSIALTPLVGLLLNYVWNITLTSILTSLSILILALCGLSYLRRLSIPLEERFDVDIKIEQPNWSEYDTIDRLLVVATVVLLISSGVLAAYIITTPRTGERFTEFYILGPEGMADDYVTSLTVNQSSHLIVGIVNREHSSVDYELCIGLGNEPGNMTNAGDIPDDYNISLTNNTYMSADINLEHLDVWQQHINVSVEEPGSYRLIFFLRVEEEVYRTLHMWVTVTEEE